MAGGSEHGSDSAGTPSWPPRQPATSPSLHRQTNKQSPAQTEPLLAPRVCCLVHPPPWASRYQQLPGEPSDARARGRMLSPLPRATAGPETGPVWECGLGMLG